MEGQVVCRLPGCGEKFNKRAKGRENKFHSPRCRREYQKLAQKLGRFLLDGLAGCVACQLIKKDNGHDAEK